MAETRERGGKRTASKGKSRKRLVTAAKAGAAIGIGSAALVAALLYANRPETADDADGPPPSDPRFEPLDS
jgi:hypothetical protein